MKGLRYTTRLKITPTTIQITRKIHFWIGEHSVANDFSLAAGKAFDMDAMLSTKPLLIREVQKNESQAFIALFKDLIYMNGSSRNLFNPADIHSYKPRLLRVKSQDPGLISEAPISFSSLNEAESFIFDAGQTLMIWHGRGTRTVEKHKVCFVFSCLCDDFERLFANEGRIEVCA